MDNTDSVIHHELEISARDRSSSFVSRSPKNLPRDNTTGRQRFAILWDGHLMTAVTRTAHMWAGICVERRRRLRQKLSTNPKICSATPVRHNSVQICRSQRIENHD